MSKTTVVFIEDLSDIESEYNVGDPIVCNFSECSSRGIHLGRVLAIKPDRYLVVQFHDRIFSELARESQVNRYVA